MSFETPQRQNRLGNIQALRGFAALFVMFSHLLIIEQKYSIDQLLPLQIELLMIGVDLFFAISGFIMVYVVMHRGVGMREVQRFLFSRASRIYPLYWLVSFAVLIVYFVRPDMVNSSFDQPPNLIKSFLLWPESRPPLLAVGWTLVHEMGFYLIFDICLFFQRKFLPLFLIIWTLILAAGQVFDLDQKGPALGVLFSPLSYTFLLGALAGLVFMRNQSKHNILAVLVAFGLWAATLGYLIFSGHGMIESHWGRFIHFGLPSALLVYAFASMKSEFPKFTQTLGDWSYALYLTHVLTLSLLGRMWSPVTRPGPVDNILAMILMSLAAILIAGATHKLFEKPMLNWATKTRISLFGS